MKILSISDVHGSSVPLSIAKKHIDEVDKAIFQGDYVDSFDSKWPTQKEELEKIFEFKEKYPNKVDLVWGNHDHSYISEARVSGHQNASHVDIQEFFKSNLDKFNVAYVYDKWAFTHAGLSKLWMECPMDEYLFAMKEMGRLNEKWDPPAAVTLENINKRFHNGEWSIFDHLSMEPSGNSPIEGPLWIRPRSLVTYGIEGYNQCVGHTEFVTTASFDMRVLQLKNIAKEDCKKDFTPEQLELKYVFTDSHERNIYAVIDTETNDVKMFKEEI